MIKTFVGLEQIHELVGLKTLFSPLQSDDANFCDALKNRCL